MIRTNDQTVSNIIRVGFFNFIDHVQRWTMAFRSILILNFKVSSISISLSLSAIKKSVFVY